MHHNILLITIFFIKMMSSTIKPIVLLFDLIGVIVCFVVMATAAAGTLSY